MKRTGVALIAFFALIPAYHCDTPTDDSGDTVTQGPGAIISPAAQTSLLAGDTVEITWTNSISNAEISYNNNDSDGINYSDAEWHAFPDSQILSVAATSARIRTASILYNRFENFRLKVTDTVSGKFSESGQLRIDHFVLLSPAGGESFAVGESVPLRFKRNRFGDRVYCTFIAGQGGIPVSLLNPDVNFQMRGLAGGNSVFDTTWVIGSESWGLGTAEYPSDSCYIYAYSYYLGNQFRGDPVGDNSDHNPVPFSITAP